MEQVTCDTKQALAQQAGGCCANPVAQEALDELEAHVQCCLGGRVRQFRVECKNGGLVLQGQSHTYHAKQLAQQRVMEMCDLPILSNEITVE